MGWIKKLSNTFNGTVTRGSYLAMTVVTGIGIGIGAETIMDQPPLSARPPVEDTMLHNQAEARVRTLLSALVQEEQRFDFNARALQAAQENMGRDGASLPVRLRELDALREQSVHDYAAIAQHVSELRRDILFEPTFSEQDVAKLSASASAAMPYYSQARADLDMSLWANHRDEAMAQLSLPLDPSKATAAQDKALEGQMENDAAARSSTIFHTALEEGGLAAAGMLGLSGIGAIVNRRRAAPAMPTPPAIAAAPTEPEPKPKPPRDKSKTLSL